ncbi:MAG: Gfo/Idh/MocA family oxidoreductase [Planctomycetota bacterium]
MNDLPTPDGRRDFLKTSAAGLAGLYVGAGSRRASAAGAGADRVRLAVVGIGGRGFQLIEAMDATGLAEFVAFADIDPEFRTAKQSLAAHPEVPFYTDFRRMLDAHEAEIDAVVVATPDHTHVPPAIDAMRRGKALYCEKPLAHTFEETQLLLDASRKFGVLTQMGNQGHSAENLRQAIEFERAGLFDGVKKVIAHQNMGRRWKPLERAKVDDYFSEPRPGHVAWDLWIGPRADAPYSKWLHPAKWRLWWEFGAGSFGDWGPHTLDTAHRFLELGLPTRVEAVHRKSPHSLLYPEQSTIRLDFPANDRRGPIEVEWRDGGYNDPEKIYAIPATGKKLYGGKQFHFEDKYYIGHSHSSPLYAFTRDDEPIETPDFEGKETAARWTTQQEHYHYDEHILNFLRACKGLEEPNSPFEIGAPLVQAIHVGRVAMRLGGALTFDPATKRFTGPRAEAANSLLSPPAPKSEWAEYFKI